MPTGYTAGIENGKIDNGSDFLKVCSRAFGALIHMREDPLENKIRKAECSEFYTKRLNEAKEKLNEILSMSDKQIEVEIKNGYDTKLKEYKDIYNEGEEKNKKYNHILAEVLEWIPPTDDHEGLKSFAIDQIKISMSDFHIEYKDKTPDKFTIPEWRKTMTELALNEIEYYSKAIKEETESINDKNKWVDDLLQSL